MERKIIHLKKYSVWGFLFTSALGTLLHFVYEWSGENPIVGLFAPVNESTWEHMKMLFFPAVLYLVYAAYHLPDRSSYPAALMTGIFLGLIGIPVLYYTYSGVLGFHVTAVDIAIFYVSVLITFFTGFRLSDRDNIRRFSLPLLILLCLLAFSFFLFTFSPPDLGIFQDPTAHTISETNERSMP